MFIAGPPERSVVTAGRIRAGVGRTVIVPVVVPLASSGAFFGSTTTLVPTSTRLKRSLTSSLVMRMQPEDTNFPMVVGSLVPWMRYSLAPRYIARAPSGLPGPPAMKRGREGWRVIISDGGAQSGHSALRLMVSAPDQVKPWRPTPTP